MIILIDNYDSFVYNIIQWIPVPRSNILVCRNDKINIHDIEKNESIEGIIISPGPMSPAEAGLSNQIIDRLGRRNIPILGICLGHQCIGEVFGCKVARHRTPMHGRQSEIRLNASALFEGLSDSIIVGRYHSLEVQLNEFNHDELKITAYGDDGTVMAIEHRSHPIYGVQFHPESVLTGSAGKRILKNFTDIISHKHAKAFEYS
jgi:anthranilate synthase/aminodeoxychorismate synthase-like glutamine amidotransferase